jgi:hypothetical protein
MRNIRQDTFLTGLYDEFKATTPKQKYDMLIMSLERVYGTVNVNPNLTIKEKIYLLEEQLLNTDGIRQVLR